MQDVDRGLLSALRANGEDAVSFQALEAGMRRWVDDPPPRGTGAIVAYADTGSAWVAAGKPLIAGPEVGRAAARFIAAGRTANRRAAFFATESPAVLDGCSALLLGQQPVFHPSEWTRTLATHRKLREQLRRARAKGLEVRKVAAHEFVGGTPLRQRIDELAACWLASRRMEPMGFLVAVEPFHVPEEHRYFVAERGGVVVAFLSAVPIYARRGWLVEDILRSGRAPNGTTECLLDAFMRDVHDAELVTLGLAPLTGPVAGWQRAVRRLSRPLYDFDGVRSFKERLHPAVWCDVWMCFPRGESPLRHLADALRAFAAGSLWRFGLRTVVRHPGGPPWVLALPLVPWTGLLAVRAAVGMAPLLGWPRPVLAMWAGFDALLCLMLFRVALRPTARRLLMASAASSIDAGLSVHHLVAVGAGAAPLVVGLRITAAAAPVVGTVGLWWAAWRARVIARQAGAGPG